MPDLLASIAWPEFIIGAWLGVFAGVLVMSLLRANDGPDDNQFNSKGN